MEEDTHRKELADLKNKLVEAEGNLSEQTKRRDDLEKQEQQTQAGSCIFFDCFSWW